MINRKEKRDIVLSMCLGDGCLAYTSNRRSATLTIGHGLSQTDYLELKRQYLSLIWQRDIKIRTQGNGTAVQLSICVKRFKAWRKFIYKDGKKDVALILPFIINPERALAFWLMDDGYCEVSTHKQKNGENSFYGGGLRLYTCDQTLQTHEIIKDWFYKNFDVSPIVKIQNDNKHNKAYPFLKFTQSDSLKIWEKIRQFILSIDSMKHKFRYMEQTYQKKLSQRTTP